MSPRQPKPRKEKKKRKKQSFFNSFSYSLLKVALMLLAWGISLAVVVVLWFSQDLPDLNKLRSGERKPSVTIQSINGEILATYGDLYEDVVKVEDLPPYVPNALMAVEDRRFYNHYGVDLVGLFRAAVTNFKANRVVQGGSTLTQQLAKNLLFSQGYFKQNDRSIKRKIQEVILAFWLEYKFTKNEILTLYLNRVYFGSGTYGIDAASRRYFNKSARSLSVFESAVIAGLLKAPSKYSPAHNPVKTMERAKVVLQQMVEANFIKDTQTYIKEGEAQLKEHSNNKNSSVRYFADWVYETLPNIVGQIDKDLVVVTTIDKNMQQHAENVCKEYNVTMGKELKASEIAFIAMSPKGAVKAMIGGKNYAQTQYNRATQAPRQYGSAFKTVIYLAALENGLTPDTMIDDTPIVVGNWRPSNYKWKSRGEVSLRDGIAFSVNAVSIRLAQLLTPAKIIEVARRLGITSHIDNFLSIALGACEGTLLELTSVHATFANEGRAVWPYGILEIRDRDGNILYNHSEEENKKIIQDVALSGMRELLRGVTTKGSGRAANVDGNVSGKTGSNGDRDAWFIGYRESEDDAVASAAGFTNIVVGVWVGNDDNKPMAKRSTGGRMPTRVAAAFLKGPQGALHSSQANNKPSPSSAELKKEHKPKAQHSLDDYVKGLG